MSEPAVVAARLLNGMLAGAYFAFAVAVIPAIRSLPDNVFVRVMNRINVVIVNPAFLAVFLGAPLLACLLLVWRRDPVLVAAAGLAVLALVITVAGNVPLNDALAAGGSRSDFEKPWLVWHAIRTVAALGSTVLLGLSRVAAP